MKPLSDGEWKDKVVDLLTQIINHVAYNAKGRVHDGRVKPMLDVASSLYHDVVARKQQQSDF